MLSIVKLLLLHKRRGDNCDKLTLEEFIETNDWAATIIYDRAKDRLSYSELEHRVEDLVKEEYSEEVIRGMVEEDEDLVEQRKYVNDAKIELQKLLQSPEKREEAEGLEELIQEWEEEYEDMIDDAMDDMRRELQFKAAERIEEETKEQ